MSRRYPDAEPIDWSKLPPLLTVTETARLLRIGKTTLYDLINAGEFPVRTLGKNGRLKVSSLALRGWLAEQTPKQSNAA